MRPRIYGFILSCLLLGVGIGSVVLSQTSFFTVSAQEVEFYDDHGNVVQGILQIPRGATNSSSLPGAVVIHGTQMSKEWMMAFGIELSRRGMVVLTIDAAGHGNSDLGNESGIAAFRYLQSVPSVDPTQIALIGFSMGGGIIWQTIAALPLIELPHIRAVVLIGTWVDTVANTTFPANMLVAVGSFDELSSYPKNRTALYQSFGTTDIQSETVYGSFSNNTARQLILARTNHLFSPISPIIVRATIGWCQTIFTFSSSIPFHQIVYPLYSLGGFVSCCGILLSTLFLSLLIFSIFKSWQQHVIPSHPSANVNSSHLTRWVIYYNLLSLGSFAIFASLGFLIPFPQRFALPIAIWSLGNGLVAILVYLLYRRKKASDLISVRDLFLNRQKEKSDAPNSRKITGFLILLVLFLGFWLYIWTFLIDRVLSMDFRFYLPLFNDLPASRLPYFLLYVPFFLVYFCAESLWFFGLILPKAGLSPMDPTLTWRQLIKQSCYSGFYKILPFGIIVLLQFSIGFLFNFVLIPGFIGFLFMFFYVFIPIFLITTALLWWFAWLTRRYFPGILFNAFLLSWILSSVLSIS